MTTGNSCVCLCRACMRVINSSRSRRTGDALPSLSHNEPSRLICICIGVTGVVSTLPTLGNVISPGVISGAVIMKITSSTSITSMYGTTLIWLIDLRGRRIALPLPLQDVGEFFDERFEACRQTVDVVRIPVIGDDGGNRVAKPKRRCNQRLGDAWRDLRQCRLADALQAAKRIHDPPHGAEQPDVRTDRSDGRQPREIRLQRIDFALVRRARRAARA